MGLRSRIARFGLMLLAHVNRVKAPARPKEPQPYGGDRGGFGGGRRSFGGGGGSGGGERRGFGGGSSGGGGGRRGGDRDR